MQWHDAAIRAPLVELATLDQSFAEEMASVHLESLPGDVLPAMGLQFLGRYFRLVLLDSNQRVVGALSSGRLIGFCQLSFTPVSVAHVLKSDPRAILAVLRLALFDTLTFLRGIRLTIFRPTQFGAVPEISFIVVRSDFQRLGIGKRMVEFANRLAIDRGWNRVITKTENAFARKMYEAAFGARVFAARTLSGRTYWYLCWDLTRRADDKHVPS